MKDAVLKNGLIGGIIGCLMTLGYAILYKTGNLEMLVGGWTSAIIGIVGLVLMVAFCVLAVKQHREAEGDYDLPFGKAFLTGLAALLIYVALTSAAQYTFQITNPNFNEEAKVMILERMERNPNMSEDLLETMEERLDKQFGKSPAQQIVGGWMFSIPIVIIISLIVAGVVRKGNNTQIV